MPEYTPNVLPSKHTPASQLNAPNMQNTKQKSATTAPNQLFYHWMVQITRIIMKDILIPTFMWNCIAAFEVESLNCFQFIGFPLHVTTNTYLNTSFFVVMPNTSMHGYKMEPSDTIHLSIYLWKLSLSYPYARIVMIWLI